ncbi:MULTISPECIES: amino acid aminotransferase [unclassified Deinococcus]|uniref:amino acid aminotransferase n=1 Tax=unclassified Deinococcus TaxID=2623546 RepID=UPI001C303EF4|nr:MULTISPECIES: aromatic amino acid transaminase [unclassified Deinococcus]MDK2012628.1 aromatic amino acid transaminase [Deinococcus sp. 43]
MFSDLHPLPLDPLWALQNAHRDDPRPHKLNLGIGIYRDAHGHTPVLNAVQHAERILAEAAPSKVYRPLSGNADFNAAMTRLLLGDHTPTLDRAVTVQTVGGTGALRTLADLIASAHPDATVWTSNPGYANHHTLMRAAGLLTAEYPWQDDGTGQTDLNPILGALDTAQPGDVLLVQGCCHNPTGIDLSEESWHALATHCQGRGLIPLVDMAYQGLGQGLTEDAQGLRIMTRHLGTVLIAASCSKNMGLYCERTGTATVLVPQPSGKAAVLSVLEGIARRTYSMPPEHGAAIAAALLNTPHPWHQELGAMRDRIRTVRTQLGHALRDAGAPHDLLTIEHHQGMFSLLPLTPEQMDTLRDEHAIYGTREGRINIAGIPDHAITPLAHALIAVYGREVVGR